MAMTVPPSSVEEIQLFNIQALEGPLCGPVKGSQEDFLLQQCLVSMEKVRASHLPQWCMLSGVLVA